MDLKLTQKDHDAVIDYINYVSTKATFKQTIAGIIEFRGLLTFIQLELLPKIISGENITSETVDKTADFMNYVAKHAVFEHSIVDCNRFFNMLTYMQKILLPKLRANIFEVEKIIKRKDEKPETKSPEKSSPKSTSGTKKASNGK